MIEKGVVAVVNRHRNKFGNEFGLKGHPGKKFTVDPVSSFVNENQVIL